MGKFYGLWTASQYTLKKKIIGKQTHTLLNTWEDGSAIETQFGDFLKSLHKNRASRYLIEKPLENIYNKTQGQWTLMSPRYKWVGTNHQQPQNTELAASV